MLIGLKELVDNAEVASILAFFAVATPRSYGENELVARLELPAPALNRACQKLVDVGLLEKVTKFAHSYWLINPKHKLWEDVCRGLGELNVPMHDDLMEALKELGQLQQVYLSGLFTGQLQFPADLVVVGEVDKEKLQKFLVQAQDMLGQELDYTILSVDDFKLRRSTYDRFVRDLFEHRHVTVFPVI